MNKWIKSFFSVCTAVIIAFTLFPVTVQASEQDSSSTQNNYAKGEALIIYEPDEGFYRSSAESNSLFDSREYSIEASFDFTDDSDNNTSSYTMYRSSGTTAKTKVGVVKSTTLDTNALMAKLKACTEVKAVQPNYTHELMSVSDPTNDILYTDGLQWGLDSQWGVDYKAAINAESNATTENNIVAVIDSGVDYTNEDLKDVMWKNPGNIGLEGTYGYDFGNNDSDPMPGCNGVGNHGTHCAGLIAASTDNGKGVAAPARHTKIMALKAMSDDGVGPYDIACLESYQYIIKAKKAGQNIVAISNSWGVGSYQPVLDYIVDQAGKAGIISLFAAGNSHGNTEDYSSGSANNLQSKYVINVAASNYRGEIASFSSYNATDVDIAAPGTGMISTVIASNDKSSRMYPYNPTIQELSGAHAEYQKELGTLAESSGRKINVWVKDGDKIEPADSVDEQNFKLTKITESNNIQALQITVNVPKLSKKDISCYYVNLSWADSNPFYQMTNVKASDYQTGVSMHAYSADSYGYSPATSISYYRGPMKTITSSNDLKAIINSSSGMNEDLSFMQSYEHVLTDDELYSTTDTVGNNILINFDPNSEYDTNNLLTFDLEMCGIVKNSEIAQYGYMSGTSMATPLLAGCFAELAWLYPNDTPLQLRGRLLGSTKPLAKASASDTREIATNGRFTFASAVDKLGSAANSLISGTTWSLTSDANGRITIEGYGLSDATLYVDDLSHTKPVTLSSTGENLITFDASPSLFDGKFHRFDVKDNSTTKIYQASYMVPKQTVTTAGQLKKIGSLPHNSTEGDAGVLISATDRLFYADMFGQYLYSCSNPDSASSVSSWKECASAKDMVLGRSALPETKLRYAYADGKLYAFYMDVYDVDGKGDKTYVYESEYDISTDTWSQVKVIGKLDVGRYAEDAQGRLQNVFYSTAAYSSEGNICFAAVEDLGDLGNGSSQRTDLFVSSTEKGTFEQMTLPAQDLPYLQGIAGYYVKHGIQYVASVNATDHQLYTMHYDNSTWSEPVALQGQPSFTFASAMDQIQYVKANAGNGILELGSRISTSTGDTYLLDLVNAKWINLGTCVGTETTIDGAAILNDKVYVSGTEDSGNLYVIDKDLNSQIGSIDTTVKTISSGNGSASVSDWRGVSSSELVIRTGDSVTWKAVPDNGYYLDTWMSGDESAFDDNEYHDPCVILPMTLNAVFKHLKSYQIIDGVNSKWIIDQNGSMVITGNGSFVEFRDVKVDGTLLATSNYTAKSGSTIITLKKEYLDTLSTGEHSFEILWRDGTASTVFTIKAVNADVDTGDHTAIALWTWLLMIATGTGAGIFFLKKKYFA